MPKETDRSKSPPSPSGSIPSEQKTDQRITALTESNQRLQAFIAASSEVVYIMTPDWSEMRQLVGKDFIPDTHEPSRDWLERYIHPDDQSGVLAAIAQAIRTKSMFQLEHRVLRIDGTPGWTSSRALPLLDEQGEIIEWFGTASDITARREIEEASSKQNTLYAEAQKIAHVGSFEYIAATGKTVWSEEEYHIYGLDPSNPSPEYGEMLARHIHPDDAALGVCRTQQRG